MFIQSFSSLRKSIISILRFDNIYVGFIHEHCIHSSAIQCFNHIQYIVVYDRLNLCSGCLINFLNCFLCMHGIIFFCNCKYIIFCILYRFCRIIFHNIRRNRICSNNIVCNIIYSSLSFCNHYRSPDTYSQYTCCQNTSYGSLYIQYCFFLSLFLHSGIIQVIYNCKKPE